VCPRIGGGRDRASSREHRLLVVPFIVNSSGSAVIPDIEIGRILDLHAQRCRCTPEFEPVTATHGEHRCCVILRNIINACGRATKALNVCGLKPRTKPGPYRPILSRPSVSPKASLAVASGSFEACCA
jgi:hypothetical protein